MSFWECAELVVREVVRVEEWIGEEGCWEVYRLSRRCGEESR